MKKTGAPAACSRVHPSPAISPPRSPSVAIGPKAPPPEGSARKRKLERDDDNGDGDDNTFVKSARPRRVRLILGPSNDAAPTAISAPDLPPSSSNLRPLNPDVVATDNVTPLRRVHLILSEGRSTPHTVVALDDFELSVPASSADVVVNEGERVTDIPTINPGALEGYTKTIPTDLRKEYEADKEGGPYLWPPTHHSPPADAKPTYFKHARKRGGLCSKWRERTEVSYLKPFDLAVHGRISKPGYHGRRLTSTPVLNPKGFSYLPHKGPGVVEIRDCKGRTCVVIVRHHESREGFRKGLVQAAEQLRTEMPAKNCGRGSFDCIQLQVHRDTGCKSPMYSTTYRDHKKAADKFLDNPSVTFYKGFYSSMLQTYLPRAHMRQSVTNRKLSQKHGLEPLFGTFQSGAYNYKTAATEPHLDGSNPVDIPCLVQVTELKDGDKGGQLVLKELKLVLELHEGDIVIFPSALITHWNLPLADGQIRSSLALWCSANCEMWADEGCEPWQATGNRPTRKATDVLTTYFS